MENIFATFLQTAGLYDSKEICEDNIADLIELLKGNVKISAYCKECKQERVFHMKPIEYYFETYPSIADMTFPELDAYKHVISKQDRKELGTAIGLFASGIGAGSYVYLRRILERLIYQAKATAGDKVNDEEFEQARVAERIKMLQGYLPEILIKNTTIYGILSKGIHELSEEECKKYFPVVKECIYQILGMWESERRKKADEDALSKALSSISSSIK